MVNRCCVPLQWGLGAIKPPLCGKSAKIQRGLEFFCGLHDPERIAKRERANAAKRAKAIEERP